MQVGVEARVCRTCSRGAWQPQILKKSELSLFSRQTSGSQHLPVGRALGGKEKDQKKEEEEVRDGGQVSRESAGWCLGDVCAVLAQLCVLHGE